MKSKHTESLDNYLQPTYFIDSNAPDVVAYANEISKGTHSDIDKAIKLFYAVRDGFFYDPYGIELNPESMKASFVLNKRSGFCVTKAILLAAVARAENIHSRLGFADVRNHLSSKRLRTVMKTDIFVFHGYTELFLENKWVKATPAFNVSLCEKAGIKPLEFNGKNDSILHEYDTEGRQHMEYLHDRGTFPDLPYNDMLEAWKQHYPHFFTNSTIDLGGDFENDVADEKNE